MPIKSTVLTTKSTVRSSSGTIQKLTSPIALLFTSYNEFKPKLSFAIIWLNRNLPVFLVYQLNVYSHCSICSTEGNLQKELSLISLHKIVRTTGFALLASTKVGVCSYIYIYIYVQWWFTKWQRNKSWPGSSWFIIFTALVSSHFCLPLVFSYYLLLASVHVSLNSIHWLTSKGCLN